MNKIENDLLEMQDIKYRDFQMKLGLSKVNMIGVRVPLIRSYAKKMLKDNYLDYLNNPSNKYFEEILLEGILIGSSKLDLKDKFKYLDNYIYKIDNWATCDITCSSFKLKDNELEDMFNYLIKYKNNKEEYVIRFCLVMMLNYYLIDNYIDRVLLFIDDINSNNKYYIEMAIGWLLSYVYIKYKDKFIEYINKSKLNDNIKKITLKKIIESNKVSKEEKILLKTNCFF